MRKFTWEMIHGFIHLWLPILDRIHQPTGDRLHDYTAMKAFGRTDA